MRGVSNRTAGTPDAARTGADAVPGEGRVTELRAPSTWASQWPYLERDLVRYVTHLLAGDTQAAEDVAQETAIRLWQHPEVAADGEPLAGWLRTVARNIVIDRVRRRRARPAEVALGPTAEQATPVVADHVDSVHEASSLASILSILAPRHRQVVYEVYVRDRAVADVATDLGIPVGTVKSRCHTAIHQLRASWPGGVRSGAGTE